MRNMRLIRLGFLVCSCAALSAPAATIIDFEGLADSSDVGSSFAGVTFSGALVLTSGVSLNEFEFPPHSGVNVATDNGGPITGSFAVPVSLLGGYFTYTTPVTLSAFDGLGGLIAQVTSLHSSNFVSTGNTPNELLSVSSIVPIKSFALAGDPGGASFVVDDLTFAPTDGNGAVPDAAATLPLLAAAATALALAARRHRRTA